MLAPSLILAVLLALASVQSAPLSVGAGSSRALEEICLDTDAIYHSSARISACTRLIRGQFGTPHQRAQIYTTRGIALKALGRKADAQRDFDEALRLDPSLTDVRLRRAHFRFDSGDRIGAFADLDWAVRSRPRDPALLESRGYSYLAAGDARRAAADFNAALKLREHDDPDLVGVYHSRGLYEFEQRDYTSAINHFGLALARDPAGSPLSLLYRGQAYLAVGDPERALADFTLLAEAPPYVALSHEQRARALHGLGRHREASHEELGVWLRETAGLIARTRDPRGRFAIDVIFAVNAHVPLLTPYWEELNLRCNLVSWAISQNPPIVCPDELPVPRLL